MQRIISESLQCRKVQEAVLDTLYPLPKEGAANDYAFNEDLWDLSEAELLANRERVRQRILNDPNPSRWLRERFALLTKLVHHAD